MNKEQHSVLDFHRLINAPAPARPMAPSPQRRELRLKLILEELLELAEASNFILVDDPDYTNGDRYFENEDSYRGHPDLVAVADALGDLLVVVYGAGLEWGIDLEPVFNEIHRSNMTKGGGALRGDGKALKGPLFQPPALEPIIAQQMARDEWDDYPENWVEVDPRVEVRLIGRTEKFEFFNGQWYQTLDAVGTAGGKITFNVQRDPGDEINAG